MAVAKVIDVKTTHTYCNHEKSWGVSVYFDNGVSIAAMKNLDSFYEAEKNAKIIRRALGLEPKNKACPVCKNTTAFHFVNNEGWSRIHCNTCNWTGPQQPDETSAWNCWNNPPKKKETKSELYRCKCGGTAIPWFPWYKLNKCYHIQCHLCETATKKHETLEEAIKEWNEMNN